MLRFFFTLCNYMDPWQHHEPVIMMTVTMMMMQNQWTVWKVDMLEVFITNLGFNLVHFQNRILLVLAFLSTLNVIEIAKRIIAIYVNHRIERLLVNLEYMYYTQRQEIFHSHHLYNTRHPAVIKAAHPQYSETDIKRIRETNCKEGTSQIGKMQIFGQECNS